MNEHSLVKKANRLFLKLVIADAPFYFLKVHGNAYQKSNQPDFFLCVGGWMCVVEFKHPDKEAKPNPGQENEMKKWEHAGAKKLTLNNMTVLSEFLMSVFTHQKILLTESQQQLLLNACD